MRVLIGLTLIGCIYGCSINKGGLDSPPVGLGAEEPSMIVSDDGLILSWMEPFEGDILLKMAIHDGSSWSDAKTIVKGDDWFVNWADYPALAVNGNRIFAHFLQKQKSETLAYNIMYMVSEDLGETWTKPMQLHQDSIIAEHGFVSTVPYDDGFYVTWLDGRETIGNTGNFTLRGVQVKGNGDLTESILIDDNTCTCCQTTMALMDDVPYSFYRNRTDEEIRDIYYSKLENGNWSEPQTLNDDNWLIPGCPVNGPVAKSYENTMAVAWFTGADKKNNVKLKISSDKGISFAEPLLVEGPQAYGRVDVQMDSSAIYVTYMVEKGDRAAIMLKTYNFSGEFLGREVLEMVSAERGTGFPKTAIWDENLVIAFTDVETNSIKIIKHPLNIDKFNVNSGRPSGM